MDKKRKHSSSILRRNIRKFCNNRLAMLGLIVVVIIVFMCVCAPLFTSFDPSKPDFKARSQAPSDVHYFGTDNLGRDVFSRMLYGGRVSILIGVTGAVCSALLGVVMGSISGYFGGKIDTLLIRLSEIFQTFPQMILILLLGTVFGRGVGNLLFIFSITGWMSTYRMVRNEFLALKTETYVQVCEAFGMSKTSIMFKQILPNVLSPVIVSATTNVSSFILSEAGLSFIGVGVPSSVSTWGNILNAAKSIDVVMNTWWLWLLPGLVLSLFVLACNFFGDGLRDVIDPKQQ